MITIACVLKTGGDYDVDYVRRLQVGVAAHLSVPYRFVCLSDVDVPCERIPLVHSWPGWWAKMELFKLRGPVLYLDLDTVIVGSLDQLANHISTLQGSLIMLRGFYKQDRCSGLLGWNGDVSKVFDDFYESYAKTATFKQRPNATYMIAGRQQFRGDQEWLREYLKGAGSSLSVTMAQDIMPGIYSYKVHVQRTEKLPQDAKIICFHGRPRPVELDPAPDWLKQHWRPTSRAPLSHAQLLSMSRGKWLTNYPNRHDGATLLILGGSETGLLELKQAQAARPGALVAAVDHAAASAKVDMIVSDHYEVHGELRSLQDQFGKDHYTTHCTFMRATTKYPAIDYWWSWRRAEASSIQTAIRIGLATGCKEIILCGCPLEHGTIQHPLQRSKDGDDWPPPRDIEKYGRKRGRETSEEILIEFRKKFAEFAVDWRGKVFSMSGFTRDILGAPGGLGGDSRSPRQQVIKRWCGQWGAKHSWPERMGRWPDDDSLSVLQELCEGVVCEVGCGIGRCAEAFPPERYIGLDINREAIERARLEYPLHRFETVKWDDSYPGADTYLFYTTLLHIPDDELMDVFKRTSNGNGKQSRLVIFETMSGSLRSIERGNYQRNISEYKDILTGLNREIIELRELPSETHPFVRHFMVAE